MSQDNQEHDHWISYALNDLYRVVHDDAYVEHAYKIARAILSKQHRAGNSPAPDWVGTFYEGQTTPASTRLEAYAADVALSRVAGRADGWLLEPAKEVAASMLGQQFGPTTTTGSATRRRPWAASARASSCRTCASTTCSTR